MCLHVKGFYSGQYPLYKVIEKLVYTKEVRKSQEYSKNKSKDTLIER